MHDLEIVTVLDAHLSERCAWHDLQIALDGHPQRIKAKLIDHLRHGDPTGDAAMLAVHADSQASVEAHDRGQ
jgi:hypothetical protein